MEVGIKELSAKTGREYQETGAEVREMEEPTLGECKLTAAAQREREELITLGVYGSDEESNVMESTMILKQEYSNRYHQKQARVASKLAQWNRMDLKGVNSPRPFWLNLSKSVSSRFPVLPKLVLNVFSIPAMSAECERGFSETKRMITLLNMNEIWYSASVKNTIERGEGAVIYPFQR